MLGAIDFYFLSVRALNQNYEKKISPHTIFDTGQNFRDPLPLPNF